MKKVVSSGGLQKKGKSKSNLQTVKVTNPGSRETRRRASRVLQARLCFTRPRVQVSLEDSKEKVREGKK